MIKTILLTAVVLSFAGTAYAKQLFSPLSDNAEYVTKAAEFARENLKDAKMSNGKKVGRESRKEKKQPLLPFDKEQEVFDRGVLAVTAEWCGIEWQKASFEPFMDSERKSGQWNDKQLAYMGVMHGFTMGMVGHELSKAGDCQPKHKAAVKKYLAQK
jgi:hypothetical protein